MAHGRPEHAEGAFYVWTHEEIATVLADDAPFFCAHFSVTKDGNVPAQLDPQGELRGRNILAQRRSLLETAKAFELTPEAANDKLLGAFAKLRAARALRPRPHLDDKILTANNGLMISALAKAHQVLGQDDVDAATSGTTERWYLSAAIRAAEFVRRELSEGEHGERLFRSWREGRSEIAGFAEDYAFLIQGLLDLYEALFDIRWLQWAERLQRTMDERFWDNDGGGYFNSAAGDASIVLRLKEDYDGAEPAPSSVAALNLFRLSALLNLPELRERGRRTLEAFRAQWTRAPHALPQMLCALELALEPPRHAVLAGTPEAADFRALVAVLHERIGPRRAVLAVDGGEAQRWLAERAAWLAEMRPQGGRATAYLCEELACQAPATEPDVLRRQLR